MTASSPPRRGRRGWLDGGASWRWTGLLGKLRLHTLPPYTPAGGIAVMRSSSAARALREAQSAAAYARRAGCDIDEAAGALATGGAVSRRDILRGGAAAALAAAIPVGAAGIRPAAATAGRDQRVVIIGSGIAGTRLCLPAVAGTGVPARSTSTTRPGLAGVSTRSAGSSPTGNTPRSTASSSRASTRACGGSPPASASPGQRQRLPAAHPGRRLPVPFRWAVLAAGGAQPRVARLGVPAVL